MPKHNLFSDPRAVPAHVPPNPGKAALVVGLDLGTTTGVAMTYHHPEDPIDPTKLSIISAQFDLSAGPYDSGAIRFVRLRQFLSELRPSAIFYELVRNTPAEAVTKYNAAALLARAATAAQLFGAYQSHVCAWAEENGVPCTSFSIQEIKKRATGKGNANKEQVIAAANDLFHLGLDPENYQTSGVDNLADAAYCLLLGLERYGRGMSGTYSIQDQQGENAVVT